MHYAAQQGPKRHTTQLAQVARPRTAPSATNPDAPSLVIYELGSTSLRRHAIYRPARLDTSVTTTELPWDVSHQFYAKDAAGGRRSSTSDLCSTVASGLQQMLDRAHSPNPTAHAVILATGVFREIDDLQLISNRVHAATGLRIKLITGPDEARLMASAARKAKIPTPALITDLGGSTLQYAALATDLQGRVGSVQLGAIRTHHQFASLAYGPERYLRDCAAYCDALLRDLPKSSRLYAVGGTAKTLAEITGHSRVTTDELRQLVAQLLYEGPPPGIEPNRARVLLPGTIISWRLAVRAGANAIEYQGGAIRDGMLQRFGRAVMRAKAPQLHASQILKPTFGR